MEFCFICGDKRYYMDLSGQWHNCPKCTDIALLRLIEDDKKNSI